MTKFKFDTYFNAGVMLRDYKSGLKKANEYTFGAHEDIRDDINFFQDVLNKFFDGSYLKCQIT